MRRTAAITATILLVLLLASPSPAQPDESDRLACSWHLKGYLDALLAGDLDSARTFWRPRDLTTAARLGITYPGPALKVDGASPVWRLLGPLRAGDADYVAMPSQLVVGGPLDGTVNVMLALDHGGQRVRHRYFFDRIDGRWLLASPVRLACEAGPGVSGRSVTVYERRPGAPWSRTQALAVQLDSCVVDITGRLELAGPRLDRLEAQKLGYLLVAPELVESLAGAPTVGVANLQQDVVVSSHPCHAHELVHLLVNHWLGELPLYTLPLLQEGVATHLGGRWGRHRCVLARVGRMSLAEGLVDLDALLTRDGFLALGADLSYPPAGVVAGHVLRRFGAAGLRRVYLALSGSLEEVAGWDAAAVRRRLGEALGVSWADFEDGLAEYLARRPESAMVPAMGPEDGSATTLDESSGGLRVRGGGARDRRYLALTVTSAAGEARGALLFGGGREATGPNALFAEHFPGRPYRGETHGLLFSFDEAKLYDYGREMLIALHAQGFWPAAGYADAEGTRLSFGVRRDLLPPGRAVLVDLAE